MHPEPVRNPWPAPDPAPGPGRACRARSSSGDHCWSALKTNPMMTPSDRAAPLPMARTIMSTRDSRASARPALADQPGGQDGGDEEAHGQPGAHHDPAHHRGPGQGHRLQQHQPADGDDQRRADPHVGGERRKAAPPSSVQRTASGSGRSARSRNGAEHKRSRQVPRETPPRIAAPWYPPNPGTFPCSNATPARAGRDRDSDPRNLPRTGEDETMASQYRPQPPLLEAPPCQV